MTCMSAFLTLISIGMRGTRAAEYPVQLSVSQLLFGNKILDAMKMTSSQMKTFSFHEFAHTIFSGVAHLPEGVEYDRRLNTAYEAAIQAGLWAGTYAGENPDEYWAEGVQSWFGLNDPSGEIHNEINTRAELEVYDPVLVGLIREIFGDVTVSASCHETIDLKRQFRIRGGGNRPGRKASSWIGALGLAGRRKQQRTRRDWGGWRL